MTVTLRESDLEDPSDPTSSVRRILYGKNNPYGTDTVPGSVPGQPIYFDVDGSGVPFETLEREGLK